MPDSQLLVLAILGVFAPIQEPTAVPAGGAAQACNEAWRLKGQALEAAWKEAMDWTRSPQKDLETQAWLQGLVLNPRTSATGYEARRARRWLRKHPWVGGLMLAAEGEEGERMLVTGSITDEEGKLVTGTLLRVFQTDVHGKYTPARAMDEPHARLQGWLRPDEQGRFAIRTIRPGYYAVKDDESESRRIPAHLHIEVSAPGYSTRRLQLVFDDDPRMTPYWREWAQNDENILRPVTKDAGGVARVECEIVLEGDSGQPLGR